MAMRAEHRLKSAALHRQWWRLHLSEKILAHPTPQKSWYLKSLKLFFLDKLCQVKMGAGGGIYLHVWFFSS